MMVSDIISRDVEVVSPETTVTHIAMAMKDRNCGSIPVVEHDRLVGMVTDRDIVVRCIAAGVDPARLFSTVLTGIDKPQQ